MKRAVILFNLGGPDSLENVKPFLFNLFNDPAIIGLPKPFRTMLAKFISGKRDVKAQEIYKQIGNKSPILALTQLQAEALQEVLGESYRVFISMRYWHPMSDEVVRQVKEYAPDEIILLPLYPQFSTTTTESSILDFKRAYSEPANFREICCYPLEENFIAAHVSLIQPELEQHPHARVLFSAHGLPEKVIAKGDPYQWQVEQTAKAVANKLGLKDWRVCYQSKVGPLPWLKPNTVDEIKQAGTEKKEIILIPIAFVSEHSETLVELDIEFKHIASESGVPEYIRIPALGVHPQFINALAALCESETKQIRQCPQEFSRCFCKKLD